MKRMVLVLTVALMMAVMMVAMAAPAFARGDGGGHFVTIDNGPNAGSLVGGEGVPGEGGKGCGAFGCHGPRS